VRPDGCQTQKPPVTWPKGPSAWCWSFHDPGWLKAPGGPTEAHGTADATEWPGHAPARPTPVAAPVPAVSVSAPVASAPVSVAMAILLPRYLRRARQSRCGVRHTRPQSEGCEPKRASDSYPCRDCFQIHHATPLCTLSFSRHLLRTVSGCPNWVDRLDAQEQHHLSSFVFKYKPAATGGVAALRVTCVTGVVSEVAGHLGPAWGRR
jgi:hypothetical protein